jgi:putative endonuclease
VTDAPAAPPRPPLPSDFRQVRGRIGEEAAAAELSRRGYRILERNWRARTPGGGELDLVALDGEVLVFVEVRLKTSAEMGSPFESVTRRKQRKIARAGSAYLMEMKVEDRDCRFDVVGVTFDEQGRPQCEVIQDAFVLGEERWNL